MVQVSVTIISPFVEQSCEVAHRSARCVLSVWRAEARLPPTDGPRQGRDFTRGERERDAHGGKTETRIRLSEADSKA